MSESTNAAYPKTGAETSAKVRRSRCASKPSRRFFFRSNCRLCGGSGWKPAGRGVTRCECFRRAVEAFDRKCAAAGDLAA